MLLKDINEILNLKTQIFEIDKSTIIDKIKFELSKFNFDEDYLKEGNLVIEGCEKIIYFTSNLENFVTIRSIDECTYPNVDGIPQGKRSKSEFNIWDYSIEHNYLFEDHNKTHEIEDSHHAVGCTSCKQKGRVRCHTCSGSGDLRCDDCNGRGEKTCRSCHGRGDSMCWGCGGKGQNEVGWGDNKRIENCSHCGGRGRTSCSDCRNGYINCSTCSGRGRKVCYRCEGSREIDCDDCDGYKSIDHYFKVNAKFTSYIDKFFLTQPIVGFDLNLAKSNNFDLKKIVFESSEPLFNKNYFRNIQSHPLYDKLIDYFDFKNTNQTKLIASRISIYENEYVEVNFTLYDEKYTLYFDSTFTNSYYSSKKPSDQYELDLLNKFLKTISKNELGIAKKTIEKLSEYQYINIYESQLAEQINIAQTIYEANQEIKNKCYSCGEEILKTINHNKYNLEAIRILIKKLNKAFFKNTLIFGLISILPIVYLLFDKSNEFIFINLVITSAIVVISLLLNKLFRNIHTSRFLIIFLFAIQFGYIFYKEKEAGLQILSDSSLKTKFFELKNRKYTVFDGTDSIIIVNETGEKRGVKLYYLPKGTRFQYTSSSSEGDGTYISNNSGDQIALRDIPLELDEKSYLSLNGSNTILVYRLNANISMDVKYQDIKFKNKEEEIEVEYIKNKIQDFKTNTVYKIYISKKNWDTIKKGSKVLINL